MSIVPALSEDKLKELLQKIGVTTDTEWKYEMRRECQEIVPGLFLGPFLVSKNLQALQQLGITHIVCIRDQKEAFSVKPRFEGHFQYLVLEAKDHDDQNLIREFPRARQFIYNALNNGGRVLVHCNGGISLSPAFVVMFVMEYHNLNCEEALHFVQSRRYCISPNGGFMTQIKEYEPIYRASQAVASFGPSKGEFQRRKRDDEDDEDETLRAEERKRAYIADPHPEGMAGFARDLNGDATMDVA